MIDETTLQLARLNATIREKRLWLNRTLDAIADGDAYTLASLKRTRDKYTQELIALTAERDELIATRNAIANS